MGPPGNAAGDYRKQPTQKADSAGNLLYSQACMRGTGSEAERPCVGLRPVSYRNCFGSAAAGLAKTLLSGSTEPVSRERARPFGLDQLEAIGATRKSGCRIRPPHQFDPAI